MLFQKKYKNARLTALLFSLLLLFSACQTQRTEKEDEVRTDYGVFIGADEEKIMSLKNYDILVIDAQPLTQEKIRAIRQNGNTKIYSYLNIGSIEEFRDCYDRFLPYAVGDYENWEEEKWIDVSAPEWQGYIYSEADRLIHNGADGLFIDNADVYYFFHKSEIYDALMNIFGRFSEKGTDVIVNGGDVFIGEAVDNGRLPQCIKGVNQESVFTSVDFENNSFGENDEDTKDYFLGYLDKCAKSGLDVYLLEYGAGKSLKEKITGFCGENGYKCCFSDSLTLG